MSNGRKRQQEKGRSGRVGVMPFYGEEYYSPLVDTPALFLKFSRLADKGGVSTGEWIAWNEKYGVLGALPERITRNSQEGLYSGCLLPVC